MKRLSQSGSSNFCPELGKNAFLISQSHYSNFALHVINYVNLYTSEKALQNSTRSNHCIDLSSRVRIILVTSRSQAEACFRQS